MDGEKATRIIVPGELYAPEEMVQKVSLLLGLAELSVLPLPDGYTDFLDRLVDIASLGYPDDTTISLEWVNEGDGRDSLIPIAHVPEDSADQVDPLIWTLSRLSTSEES